MGPKSTDSVARDLHGRWWLPDRPEITIGGILHIEADGSGDLRLFGDLTADGGGAKVVLGETEEHGATTISHAYLLSSRSRWANTIGQTFRAYGVLIGRHLPDGADAIFHSVSFESAMMPQWILKPTPHIRRDPDDASSLAIEVSVPEPLSCEIDGLGIVSLRWMYTETSGRTSASIEFRPVFVLDAAEPITTDRAWEEFVTPILLLTTLATGTPDKIVRLRLWRESPDEPLPPSEVEMVASSWSGPLVERGHSSFEQLLPFADFEPRFPDALRRWFKHFQQTRSALLTFFSVVLNKPPYLEDGFAQVARSLEAWHRAVDDNTYMSEPEFRAIMDLIRAHFSGKQREFLRMRLGYGNELPLRQRLDATLHVAGSPISDILNGAPNFSRRVVDTRNMLAHRAEIGDAFTHQEMAAAQTLMQVALQVALIREMGFPAEVVEKGLRQTPDWRWLVALDNPLTRPGAPPARA